MAKFATLRLPLNTTTLVVYFQSGKIFYSAEAHENTDPGGVFAECQKLILCAVPIKSAAVAVYLQSVNN